MTRVLVVEDESYVRDALSRILSGMDCEVIPAGDGLEAQAELAQTSFDLIVTDLSMPRADGFAVLRYARSHRPDTPVLIMTGRGSTEDCLRAMRAGAFNFLSKPFHPSELREVVRDALDSRAPQANQLEETLDLELRQPQLALVGQSPQLHELLERVDQVAATDAAVVLVGERGTGKEAIARMLHALSPRAGGVFVMARLAARTGEELEYELFGAGDVPGTLARAPGGSLLLTDVEQLDPQLQGELARTLSQYAHVSDVRVFVDFGTDHADGAALPLVSALRDDLRAVVIEIPALRDRIDDMPLLVEHLVESSNRRWGAQARAEELLAGLGGHAWPGNLAELEKHVDSFVSASHAGAIRSRQPPERPFALPVERRRATLTLEDGTDHEVELSLGPGLPISALLDPSEPFLPAHDQGQVRIYARAAIACIRVEQPDDPTDELLPRTERALRVQLRCGKVIEGDLRYVAVEGRARVTDVLNEPARCFALYTAGAAHHIAKAHVLHVQER